MATALVACAVAAFAIPALGAGHGRAFAAAGAVAALLLAVALYMLSREYDTALAAETARYSAAVGRQQTDAAAAEARRAQDAEERQRQQEEAARQAAELRRRGAELEGQYRAMTAGALAALGELLDAQIPAALAGSAGSEVPGEPAAGDGGVVDLCARIAEAVAKGIGELREEHEDRIESFRLVVLRLARLLQDASWRIQAEAAEMEEAHQDTPDVLDGVWRVDHAAAQLTRLAQSVVVLAGEWPGRQWLKPLPLLDVVRAAAGRILPYERVQVLGDPAIAAAPGINEPLIHLVAELLANATQSSPPATPVYVSVRSVPRGAVIQIDDEGTGMDDASLARAQEIIDGRRLIGLGDLGEVAQTGLAVIGHYVSRYGFKVTLGESPYRGVQAIVLVPEDKVEILDPAEALPVPAAPPLPAQAGAAEAAEAAGPGGTGTVLPQRQHRRDRAPLGRHVGTPPAEEPSSPEPTPEEEGHFLGAFFNAGAATDAPDAAAAPQETGEGTGSRDETETER